MVNIDKVAKLNAQVTALKKELDGYKAQLKADCEDGSYAGGEYEAIIKTRVSQSLNPDRALAVVKKLNANWLLKEVVDLNALEDSIAGHEIDGAEFVDCIDTKSTVAVTFKKRKNNESKRD